jgi:hypothetical protein
MTDIQAQQLVTLLVTAFPGALRGFSESQQADTMATYRLMLGDLEPLAAMAAVQRVIATHRYSNLLPTIAEIRDAVLVTTDGPKRHGADAWGDLLPAVRKYGMNRRPSFDDPITAYVIRRLGWVEFCQSEVEDMVSWRSQFVNLYDKIAQDGRVESLVAELPATRKYRELNGSVPVGGLLSAVLDRIGSVKSTPEELEMDRREEFEE